MTVAAVMDLGTATEVNGYYVAKDLLNWALAVAGAEGAERVVRLRVRLGDNPRLTPEDLEFAIRVLTRRTIAEGADVEVRRTGEQGTVLETIVLG
ncbi:MAG: hypothetical protein WD533_06305 [Dehalococcoidia bacterium]